MLLVTEVHRWTKRFRRQPSISEIKTWKFSMQQDMATIATAEQRIARAHILLWIGLGDFEGRQTRRQDFIDKAKRRGAHRIILRRRRLTEQHLHIIQRDRAKLQIICELAKKDITQVITMLLFTSLQYLPPNFLDLTFLLHVPFWSAIRFYSTASHVHSTQQ